MYAKIVYLRSECNYTMSVPEASPVEYVIHMAEGHIPTEDTDSRGRRPALSHPSGDQSLCNRLQTIPMLQAHPDVSSYRSMHYTRPRFIFGKELLKFIMVFVIFATSQGVHTNHAVPHNTIR